MKTHYCILQEGISYSKLARLWPCVYNMIQSALRTNIWTQLKEATANKENTWLCAVSSPHVEWKTRLKNVYETER